MRAAVVLGLSVVVFATVARAQPRYRVVLLRPAATDDVTSDALARVRGELTAGGFEVVETGAPAALDVRTALETVGRELNPIAAFAIVPSPGGNSAEIWVCDRMAGKSVIQSVRLDPTGKPGEPSRSVVLAVHAVELLKASLAQYWLASTPRPQAPAEAPAPSESPETFAIAGIGLQAGVGWLDSVGTVSGVFQPIVRASYGGEHGWAGRITVGGLGADATVQAPGATAQIRQELGALELVRAFRPGHRIQLTASLGAGAYHARISGVGTGPQKYMTYVTSNWSALALAGVGVVVPIVAHVSLTADAQIGLTWPENVVGLLGAEAGRTGGPALLASAGLLATF